MKLKELHLYNFGPFEDYSLQFPSDARSCILITGKNNAGKTTIIRALRLISSALKLTTNSPTPLRRQLLKKDTKDIYIASMIYRFEEGQAAVEALFDNGKTITVILDSTDNSITCSLPPHIRPSLSQQLAFLPPLGQLAQEEKLLGEKTVADTIDTTLAPLHFRNHLYYLINPDQYSRIQQILRETWEGIQLYKIECDTSTSFLTCPYQDGPFFPKLDGPDKVSKYGSRY